MAITITQNPGVYNLAYGSNAVVLSGMVNEDKYVLRIKNEAGDIVADVRQTPNRYGQAIFDVQNILQTYVSVGDNDIDSIGVGATNIYRNSFNLGFLYDIEYGSETQGVVTIDGTVNNLEVYPGRKEYYETTWVYGPWTSDIGLAGGNNTRVETPGKGLTDNPNIINEVLPGEFLSEPMYRSTIRPDGYATVSYLQQVDVTGAVPDSSKGLSAIVVYTMEADGTLLNQYQFDNIAANGGGPNNTLGGSLIPSFPYSYITFGAGPANLQDNGVDFTDVAYYYVVPYAWNPQLPGLTGSSAWYPHKFVIDQGTCLDFEPIEFSWMNSLGARDYYTFTKKNERSIRINRNTYLKNAVDYNGASYNIQPEDRGQTVYSQTLDQEYRANTDYISDLDADWLESLFVSPDVRVRFSGQTQWLPVTLTSTSYTQKTFRKDRLFQYELRFKLAHGLKSQRG